MNKPALRKLIRHLIRQRNSSQAARFNMQYFGTAVSESLVTQDMLETPVCKTQACLAGETVLSLKQGFLIRGGISLYKSLRVLGYDVEKASAKVLDLTEDQKNRLFYFLPMRNGESGWPQRFEFEYREATKTPADRIDVAIRRVAHFINTNGEE